jgi:hypothetical protein
VRRNAVVGFHQLFFLFSLAHVLHPFCVFFPSLVPPSAISLISPIPSLLAG